jgi:hypothetical protein
VADSLQAVARKLAATLQPAARGLAGSEAAVFHFLESLGWQVPAVPPALTELQAAVADLAIAHSELDVSLSAGAGGATVDAHYFTVAAKAAAVIQKLHALPGALQSQLPPGFVAATGFDSQFPRRLLDFLLVAQIRATTARLEPALRLLGLVEVAVEPPDPAKFQPEFERRTVRWDRFGKFLTDPGLLLREVHGFGTPAFDGQFLLDELMHLSFALAGPANLDWPTPERIQALTGDVPSFGAVGPPGYTIPLFRAGPAEAAVEVLPLPARGGQLPGVAVGIWARGGVPASLPLRATVTLELEDAPSLDTGVSLVLRPGQAPQARVGLTGPSGAALRSSRVGARVRYAPGKPFNLLSLPDGSRLQADAVIVAGGVALTPGGAAPEFEVGLEKGKLVIAAGDRDSFLGKLLPGGPIELEADLGLGWTHGAGMKFRGGGSLQETLPIHAQLGPFRLDSLTLGAALQGDAIALEASVSGGGSLGPIAATIERIGLIGSVALHDGNLGPVDVSIAFKGPSGAGLSLDAGVVKGGGYLSIDTQRGEYSGALQLEIADFLSVSAIGLISTKNPDGTPGFSLLIIITADFGPGIQLGFGFTLNAVGGLLGLNRTMLFGPLMDAVRSGAIESVMFPRDVVANAPRIISDLRAIFPPQEGTFLVGPMATLGWGQPTLVSASLGVIVEIPPGDIALLGVLKVALPAEDVDILKLQVNFAGALEFSKKRLYFFASLYDSHLLFITLQGEMGLLVAYGDDANFVLSVGGFHPQFNPPPLPFPNPQRIQACLINESYARIRCDTYFAVTSNTAQFGAHAEYFFGFDALSVSGHSSFDALIQFSPFHFTVSISTSFSVKVFGIGVFGIGIELTVEGPTPWHAHGKGSISLWITDIDVPIDISWGDSRDTALPPVAVMPLLKGELGKRSNWKVQLPSGSKLLVSLRKLDQPEDDLVLHPVGTLQVSQRAVPLDLTLDRMGSQKPSDANRFAVTVSSTTMQKRRYLQERFAPAQFKDFDDAAKLSQSAFSPQDSGIEVGTQGEAYDASTAVTRIVRYDLTIVDSALEPQRSRFFLYPAALFAHWQLGASVAWSALSAHTAALKDPYQEPVKASAEKFAVAMQADNSLLQADAAGFTSHAAAADFMAKAVAVDPSLAGSVHVLPAFEVAA